MRETVRLVSDGEELVLWEGEAVRISSRHDTRDLGIKRPGESATPKPIAIQYLGFHDVEGRREYLLHARRDDETRRYTVWIELAAFSKRQALLQEGPDICYQKLLRELAGSAPQGPEGIGVTEDDLAAYRETHARPVRRSFSASPISTPARTQANTSPGESQRDR